MKNGTNYLGKITAQIEGDINNQRPNHKKVFIRIYEDKTVLLFSPHNHDKSKGNFEYRFNTLKEASKHCTCLQKTDYDIERFYNKAINNRYF